MTSGDDVPVLAIGVTHVERLDLTAAMTKASLEERAIFVLPFTGIVDVNAFGDAVRASLPLDPPWQGPGWDALSDSLWEGLFQQEARRIVIFWPGAGAMFSRATDDYLIAVDVLGTVAAHLADADATQGNPKEVAVVIERRNRDDERHRANAVRLLRELREMEDAPSIRREIASGLAACARGELPIKRTFELNVFSLVIDARMHAAELRSVMSDSADDETLVTFDQLAAALAVPRGS